MKRKAKRGEMDFGKELKTNAVLSLNFFDFWFVSV